MSEAKNTQELVRQMLADCATCRAQYDELIESLNRTIVKLNEQLNKTKGE